MVLTFTCSFSVVGEDRTKVHRMLAAAIGCNLAWGIIDAIFYLMACYVERGHNILLMRQVQTTGPREGRRIVADAIPPVLVSLLPDGELEIMRQRIAAMPPPSKRAQLKKDDWAGAAGVFSLVFLSTFPVVIPFFFFNEITRPLRISNAIAILMMFGAGYSFGFYTGGRPWRVGLTTVLLGGAMVAIAVALGG